MIVAIHQPNLLPWLGYFYKMLKADSFVLLDSVPYSKGSYTNRVQVKSAKGPQWLTVPVQTSGKLGQPITELICDGKSSWQKKIAGTLEANYRNCPHYQPYAGEIVQIISGAGESLCELNVRLIEYLAAQFGIATPTFRSSRMQAQGKSTELLVGLCRELGGDVYLSGSGGRNYQDEEGFAAAGIKLTYASYKHPTYRQAFDGFAPGMSAVDLLLNCGPDSGAILRAG